MELLTLEQIVTMAGGSTVVFLIVGSTKDLKRVKQIKTFLWTAFVAFIILCLGLIALGANCLDWRLYFLCFCNSWMVAAMTGQMNDGAIKSAKKVD